MTRPPAFGAFAQRHIRREVPVQRLLEWSFGAQRAQLELPVREAPEDRGFGFGMEYVLLERARVGCQIDGGRGGAEPDVHWDAECVAAVVAHLPDDLGGRGMAVVVAECARLGTPPDWMPGVTPRLVPLDWTQNRFGKWAKAELVPMGTSGRWYLPEKPAPGQARLDGMWCPLLWTPMPPGVLAHRRDRYTAWRRALVWLAEALTTAPLRDHRLTPALPPETPWKERS